jgi:hypothetical protein
LLAVVDQATPEGRALAEVLDFHVRVPSPHDNFCRGCNRYLGARECPTLLKIGEILDLADAGELPHAGMVVYNA